MVYKQKTYRRLEVTVTVTVYSAITLVTQQDKHTRRASFPVPRE